VTGRSRGSRPGRGGRPLPPSQQAGSFAVLGLDPAADLTDDDIRITWRQIAAATHPDRADGGDPERFAAAAGAYTELRTKSGRGEARADLAAPAVADGRCAAGPFRRRVSGGRAGLAARLLGRVRMGRPARLALRILAAGAAGAIAVLAAGPGPAAPALVTGAATWLVLTARRDLIS
jgi:hypothetical protein